MACLREPQRCLWLIPLVSIMEAFFSSVTAVAIAEIGDKTQLLSLFLAARFRARGAIIAGILVATLLNHAASAWFGAWVAQFIPVGWHAWLLGGSFIAVALWLLIPDKDDSDDNQLLQYGAFVASTVLFFLAEIGDKTQIATVILAATYDSTFWVIVGTTLGMLLANVPVVFFGRYMLEVVPLDWARRCACVVFLILGLVTIVSGVSGAGVVP